MNYFWVLPFALTFPAILSAQNWVEERTYIANGVITPRINGLFTKPAAEKLGSFVWFQVQQGYSQAYAGLTYAPKSWIQVAIGPGLEEDRHPMRVGSYVWMGKGKVSTLAVFEDGGSGFWWKSESNYQITSRFGLGHWYEHGKGAGPKLEFSVPRTRAKLWLVPFINHGVQPLLGVKWSL